MSNVDTTRDAVTNVPCPLCGVKALTISDKLTPKPHATYSLAGVGTKFSMVSHPWITCGSCGATAPAK